MNKDEMVAMAKQNACNMCKKEDCKYRGLTVSGYDIYTTEHCVKNNREQAVEIIESSEFASFVALLNKYNSNSVELLKSQMNHLNGMALNELS